MNENIEDFIKHIELSARRVSLTYPLTTEELLQLAIQVLNAERLIERKISEVKELDKRKKLEEMLSRVKGVRDHIIRLYALYILGKEFRETPSPYEVGLW